MFDFHPSDLATTNHPDSKYYWQNEHAKCCITVPDSIFWDDSDTTFGIRFHQYAPGTRIVCTDALRPSRENIVPTSTDFIQMNMPTPRVGGKVVRPKNAGRILNAIFDLIDAHSWSFPRSKPDKPYISKASAILLEENFKHMVKAVDDGNCIYVSVSQAGTMLAKRMGIDIAGEFIVKHYQTDINTQDDTALDKFLSPDLSFCEGRKVVVIDDLISSGRTAGAIIMSLLKQDFKKIYFFSLYRTVCSQEVSLDFGEDVLVQSYMPISNAYWTYGRGFDLTDDASRDLEDIYACTKHWDWETPEDVEHLMKVFQSKYRLQDYFDLI